MTNIFLGSKSMDQELSNAPPTMFLRHLVMFLHFEIYVLVNPQKAWFSHRFGHQLDFLPHIYDLIDCQILEQNIETEKDTVFWNSNFDGGGSKIYDIIDYQILAKK